MKLFLDAVAGVAGALGPLHDVPPELPLTSSVGIVNISSVKWPRSAYFLPPLEPRFPGFQKKPRLPPTNDKPTMSDHVISRQYHAWDHSRMMQSLGPAYASQQVWLTGDWHHHVWKAVSMLKLLPHDYAQTPRTNYTNLLSNGGYYISFKSYTKPIILPTITIGPTQKWHSSQYDSF